MWLHPATRRNVALLREDGVEVAGPERGRHASGAGGPGRMVEPEALLGHIRRVLGRRGDLAGVRCLTTAGGTREALDPVRVLGNRSSGKMGLALARAARDRGAEVTLVSTAPAPVDCAGIDFAPVESAAEMQAAVSARLATHDVLVMAAAVADYRPARRASHKIKKSGTGSRLELALERTDDIVAAAAQAAARRAAGPAADRRLRRGNGAPGAFRANQAGTEGRRSRRRQPGQQQRRRQRLRFRSQRSAADRSRHGCGAAAANGEGTGRAPHPRCGAGTAGPGKLSRGRWLRGRATRRRRPPCQPPAARPRPLSERRRAAPSRTPSWHVRWNARSAESPRRRTAPAPRRR